MGVALIQKSPKQWQHALNGSLHFMVNTTHRMPYLVPITQRQGCHRQHNNFPMFFEVFDQNCQIHQQHRQHFPNCVGFSVHPCQKDASSLAESVKRCKLYLESTFSDSDKGITQGHESFGKDWIGKPKYLVDAYPHQSPLMLFLFTMVQHFGWHTSVSRTPFISNLGTRQ
jgi:hypothetical protein